ncbi:hypothetical protein D8895_10965 [Streptococcus sp. BCA20]|uniref:DUF1433 domain-containing protein n=1 Tax=Streptococcus intermedius TaxID=1338 RepID=A0AAD1C8X9_STRIT|nr:hypothetical protein [Streptococcus intermedius]RSJ20456.1 hypothetical protein D8829_04830 [Streptococcus intermedius]RSJ28124.1 hypothetical protein D8895_10965 [Streptococcus sp. BCA20]BAW17348.1 hypothetical protein SITYG_13690 [Streptococcus intermedius]
MGKKTKLSIVAFVIFVIGGIIMFSLNQKRAQTEAQQIRHEQERMVKYIASNYADIKKVEFTEIDYNNMTGTYDFDATVNNKIEVRFVLRGLNGQIYMNELSSYNSGHQLIKRKEVVANPDISYIKIIYKEK